ncbi:phytanoyl-CoA dioxygenase family protein [Spirulina sp. CS-785/01]|uniref:phytanoyl-CoA dioxygenase family protein n=1 Tax=Spirulina sp. CS-785/01 TaxID=3021716 RepID=UPI00232DE6FB|nr:phytanoyl-CoA dioxygenase family protein [Spirulina sp. CS-785/01]MDB9315599.1 phytanoyl-CoA dioxygenase family protein [Spirulina sp. CS-785/01]
MLKEQGYSVIDFLSKKEVQNLLELYGNNALPDDIRSSAISATVSSSELSYRQNISQQIRENLERKLTEVFPNHKIALCTFINKYPNESNDVDLHQDRSFTDEEKYQAVNLWIPLTDVDEQKGCFYVIEKSHALNFQPRAFNCFVYGEAVRSLMKQHYLTSVPMKAGQVLLYSSNLFHGSFANRSNGERLSIACILVPKDSPVLLYHQSYQNPNQVRVFEVEDTFYDTYIRGSENAETLTNSEKMRDRGIIDCSPKLITPEQLVKFMSNENPATQKNSESLFNLLRGQDWWFYKIPPLLAIAYAEILTQGIAPHPSFTTLLALTVSMFFVAAYGHVVNDIFDIDVDKKAGKPNRMASLSRGQQTVLTLGLAALGLVPWWWIGFKANSGILLAAIYLLLTVYPAPPLRLKERFVFGAVADAATVHAVPTLLVATVFANLAVPSSPSNNLLAIIATSWAFAVGIRGILLHQMWDRDNDLKSGIQTLATKFGAGTLRFWINSIVFPLEAILSTALVLVIAQSALLFLVPCATYCLMLLFIMQDEFNPSPSQESYQGKNIILHDFYEVWLPLSLLILLSLHQPIFLILLGVHIALFYPAIQQRVLVSIRQIKLNLAKMNGSQSPKTVDITENPSQPKTFLSQPAKDLERSLVQAIEFLRNNQLEDGEFPTYGNDSLSQPDSSPFVTALVLYSLSFLAADDTHSKVKPVVEKGLKFLVQAMEPGGLWRYWSSKNDRHTEIPPDLDDICCISHVLKLNNLPVPKNHPIILGNQNKEGLFYTWILPRSIPSITLNYITLGKALSHSEQLWQLTDKDDICCVVNTNVLLYLGESTQTEQSLKYVIDTVLSGKEEERSAFYNHKLSFYYMLSRAYCNGVTALGTVKTPVIAKVSSLQKADGSFGNELLTALAICTFLNFNHIVPSLDKAIQFLLNTQKADGSWPRISMYGGQLDKDFFGSEALTTGFCVEALARYRLLNLPATQPETLTTLTPQMQKELEENGYVVIDLFLSETELQDLREFDSTHPRPEDIANGTTINTSDLSYRQQVNQKLTSIVNPKLAPLLPGYRTAFCTWYRKSPNSATNATPLHQDPSLTDETETLSYGIWCPLIDVTPENGCLSVVKGSHPLNSKPRPFYPFSPFPYDSTLASLIQEHYLTPIPLKAGQAILYDKRLFHGASPNTQDQERVAFTCLIAPQNTPTHFAYRELAESETLELFAVEDDFYNRYILGEKPQGDGVTLIKTEPYTYDRLTPELIAEKLDPLHPEKSTQPQAIEQYRQTLQHFQTQAKQQFDQLQNQLYQTQNELNQLKTYLQQTQGQEGLFNYYRHCINQQPDNLDLYQEALTLQPDNLELRLQLGQTLTRQNRPEEAITTYQTALESHPHWQLYFALGQTLEQVKRDTEAITAYEQAIQLNPHHSPIHERLGDLLAQQNQLTAASQYYRRVLELQQG